MSGFPDQHADVGSHWDKDDPELREALEALYDFRQFWQDNVTQTKLGASHHNPMWARVATVLDKHGMNDGPGNAEAYYKFDPAYRQGNGNAGG